MARKNAAGTLDLAHKYCSDLVALKAFRRLPDVVKPPVESSSNEDNKGFERPRVTQRPRYELLDAHGVHILLDAAVFDVDVVYRVE